MLNMNNRKKFLILSLVLLAVFLIIYISGSIINEEEISTSYLEAKLPPSIKYPFGTDSVGRNLLLRSLKGLSTSISLGLIASLSSGLIAILVGIVAAFGSKLVDDLINWLIDLVMGVPHTILIILISFVLGKGFKGLLIGIVVTHWPSLARLIRAEVLQLKSKQYVLASKKLGKSNYWILANHLIPHLFPQFIVGLILIFPHAILHEASISFLGYGLPPDKAAIGIILSESMKNLSTGLWWTAVLPGLSLVLIVLMVDKIGEYMRLIFDPWSAQK